MITEDKITEIFCLTNDFCKHFSSELKKHQDSNGSRCFGERRSNGMFASVIYPWYSSSS